MTTPVAQPINPSTATPEQIAEVFRTAAEIIDRNPLHDGPLWSFTSAQWAAGIPITPLGAICVAAGYRNRVDGNRFLGKATAPTSDTAPVGHHPLRVLVDHLGVRDRDDIDDWTFRAVYFNDPSRVIGVFREIADELDGE